MSNINVNNVVAFDLETIANMSVLKLLPPVEAKANLKDPEKIRLDIEQKEKDRLDKMGLNPHHNMICCFAWCNGKDSGTIMLEEESNEAERDLLIKAWKLLSNYSYFVTFNGIEFDVPTMNLHSFFLAIKPSVNISLRKYYIENHVDLRAVLGNWNSFAPGNFDYYLKRIFGIGKPDDIDGSMVQHYWNQGDKDKISKYGKLDAENTFKLYQYAKKYHLMVR